MKYAVFVIGLTVLAVTSAKPRPQSSFGASYSGQRFNGQPFQSTLGVNGQWAFGNRANSGHAVSGSWSQPLSGPERRPSYNVDYRYNFVNNNRASIGASVGGQKLPGQRFQPTVGVQARWRFRRGAELENVDEATDSATNEFDVPEN